MAAKKKPTPTNDAYYEAMVAAKVAAGLPLADAQEVTARQRAEDAANGVTIGETEEESPEA
jgi:hypothetical protein